jgi:hypothetical protein
VPPPPGLFSTEIGLSIAFVSVNTLAIVRAVISQPPPAPDGAMMLSAFSGYLDAACAGAVVSLALSPVASVGLAAPLPHAAKEIAIKLIDVTFKDAAKTFFIK